MISEILVLPFKSPDQSRNALEILADVVDLLHHTVAYVTVYCKPASEGFVGAIVPLLNGIVHTRGRRLRVEVQAYPFQVRQDLIFCTSSQLVIANIEPKTGYFAVCGDVK